jgi:hypothetical protein
MTRPTAYAVLAAHVAVTVAADGPLASAQLAPPEPASLQKSPHIGTVEPSGSVTLVGLAVRLTTAWPNAAAAAKRKRAATRSVVFRVALTVWIRIAFLVIIEFFTYRDSSI